MNWEGFGRKRSWPKLGNILTFAGETEENYPPPPPNQSTCDLAYIQTKHLQHTNLKNHFLINLFHNNHQSNPCYIIMLTY
jgi:hypothetical protein